MRKYYVDTCIYLNVWKNEKESISKYSKLFLNKCEIEPVVVYYSGLVLNELKYKLQERFQEKKAILESFSNFIRIDIDQNIICDARKVEQEVNFEISFYDIMHMLLAERNSAILVTRDKNLIRIAGKYNIDAKKPEELL